MRKIIAKQIKESFKVSSDADCGQCGTDGTKYNGSSRALIFCQTKDHDSIQTGAVSVGGIGRLSCQNEYNHTQNRQTDVAEHLRDIILVCSTGHPRTEHQHAMPAGMTPITGDKIVLIAQCTDAIIDKRGLLSDETDTAALTPCCLFSFYC